MQPFWMMFQRWLKGPEYYYVIIFFFAVLNCGQAYFVFVGFICYWDQKVQDVHVLTSCQTAVRFTCGIQFDWPIYMWSQEQTCMKLSRGLNLRDSSCACSCSCWAHSVRFFMHGFLSEGHTSYVLNLLWPLDIHAWKLNWPSDIHVWSLYWPSDILVWNHYWHSNTHVLNLYITFLAASGALYRS